LEAFKDFWANKSYGMNSEQNEGNYSTFNWGDAQFFLLDDRFFKSPNDRKTGTRTILGDTQLEWLIDALSSSSASFKIIYIGGQVITSAARFENYATYPEEKEKLLKEIEVNKIKGVLFLSGDRHFTELSKLERKGTYPLYDWTVSPLTSGVSNSYKDDNNTNRVEGSLFAVNNFGTLSFSGNAANRQMKLSLFDKEGKELWNKTILKKELE
jgi:alkaline phosphatase D